VKPRGRGYQILKGVIILKIMNIDLGWNCFWMRKEPRLIKQTYIEYRMGQ